MPCSPKPGTEWDSAHCQPQVFPTRVNLSCGVFAPFALQLAAQQTSRFIRVVHRTPIHICMQRHRDAPLAQTWMRCRRQTAAARLFLTANSQNTSLSLPLCMTTGPSSQHKNGFLPDSTFQPSYNNLTLWFRLRNIRVSHGHRWTAGAGVTVHARQPLMHSPVS